MEKFISNLNQKQVIILFFVLVILMCFADNIFN